MAEREVNRESSVPASRQVAAWLREDIASGKYAPGQRLPSIADLVQVYGIARDTALKAQRVLIAEGLDVNSPGMGVYVAGELPNISYRVVERVLGNRRTQTG